MTAFPHRYRAGLSWTQGAHAQLAAPPRPPFVGGPPPEFGGDERLWSPEHLLVSAANLCLLETFLSLTGRARVVVEAYQAEAEGVLDKTPEGIAFTEIRIGVRLRPAAGQEARALELLEKAKRYCIVSNALKVPVRVASELVAGPRETAAPGAAS